MKRYIVTEKQLQMLKDKLDASYRPIPKEELREWLEDIEAQDLSYKYKRVHEQFAQEAAEAARTEIAWLPMAREICAKGEAMSMYEPNLKNVIWYGVWEKAKEAEGKAPGGAYAVFIKALEGKSC